MKKKQLLSFTIIAVAALFSFNSVGLADVSDLATKVEMLVNQMQDMQKTIDWQNKKIKQLEGKEPTPMVLPEPAGDFKENLKASIGDADKWLKDLKFSGDFRLRYEPVSFHSGATTHSGNINRFRIRLRYGFEKKLNPDMKVGFRISSGGTTDPASTNQTLTGNFVNKSNVIDKAYAIYTPEWAKKGPIEKFEVGGGKFKNPFERGSSDMVWDSDVTPEGAYETLDLGLFDGESTDLGVYLTGGQFITAQNTHGTAATNAEMYGFQGGLNPEITLGDGATAKFNNAVSFYYFSDYAHNSNFGALAGGNANADGDATTLDANDFHVLEIYNDVALKFKDLPVIKPYVDFAVNLGEAVSAGTPADENKAWAFGLKIGKAKKKGDWQAGYAYKYIEANSVVGAFNDSDFGHSGRRGSVISGKYKLTDSLEAGVTGIFVNNLNHDALAIDQDERRFLVDLVWKI